MKKSRFLLTLLMAIVMMAMSPQKMFAANVEANNKLGNMDAARYAVSEITDKPEIYSITLSDGKYIDLYCEENDKGEYIATYRTENLLPSEGNPVVDIYADYWDNEDADCSYSCDYTANEDGSVLLTINITNAAGTNVYKITFIPVISIYASPNYGSRGSVSVKVGEEEYPADEYGNVDCEIPAGSKITIKATANEDCEFVKWQVWKEEKYMDCDLPNPFTTTESIDITAVFSSSTSAVVVAHGAGPADGRVTDADGNIIFDNEHFDSHEVDMNTTVTFTPVMYHLAEGEVPGLHFVGWYDEDTDELLSNQEEYTTSVTADTYLYAKFANDVTTTNGWASYYDGFDDFTVEGGKAYIAEYVEDSDGKGTPAVKLTALEGKISEGDAILLRDTDGDNKVTLTYAGGDGMSEANEDNKLYGHCGSHWDDNLNAEAYGNVEYLEEVDEDGTFYGLYNKEADVHFRRYQPANPGDDFILPAHKAVLWLEKEYYGPCAKLNFFIDGEEADATTVEQITKALGEDVIYDLSGRRVNAANKGVYIKNGKKVMVK